MSPKEVREALLIAALKQAFVRAEKDVKVFVAFPLEATRSEK
jgi:hypothetical protein